MVQITPETLTATERILERFGFPVFVALCSLVLFAAVWRYFSKELSMTRTEFLGYLQKRDEQSDTMIEKLTDAYHRNTIAFIEMKNAVQKRIGVEEKQTEVLEDLKESIHTTKS